MNPPLTQPWHCPDCGATYTSPLPLAHPPAHHCNPPEKPARLRNMTPGPPPHKLEVDA